MLISAIGAFLGAAGVPVFGDTVVAGQWNGALEYPGGPCLPIVLHIAGASPNFTATIDQPNQHVLGVPVDRITVTGDSVAFAVNTPQISNVTYNGKIANATMTGSWSQSGGNLPTTFHLVDAKAGIDDRGPCSGDPLAGIWTGTLSPPPGGRPLDIVLHVSGSNNQLEATVDVPAAGLRGVEVDRIVLSGRKLSFEIDHSTGSNGSFTGTVMNKTITGSWTPQGGGSQVLTLYHAPAQ
jgi:hypothetical protein